MTVKHLASLVLAVAAAVSLQAQTVLSLEQCRQMALQNSRSLQQGAINEEMARYDRGIARSYFFPKISATGLYDYNNKNISLIGDQSAAVLQNVGTIGQQRVADILTHMFTANPAAYMEMMGSQMWQSVIQTLKAPDISAVINGIGGRISDALTIDITNVWAGAVTVEQPVFMGGKIIASNKMAKLAQELSATQYETEKDKTVIDTDNSYWQIVSIAAKKRLADQYCELLQQMLSDAEIAVEAGTATEADALTVKVKYNEASLMRTTAENGLHLSKMLLCKMIGLPLDSEITLADENLEEIPAPVEAIAEAKPMEQVISDRSELKSLSLASQIYDQKVKITRADALPQIGITAGYFISNPSVNNGFQNSFGDRFSAGAIVKIPIFHGLEHTQRIRKAKAEARLYRTKYDDACEKINLQVTQARCRYAEAQQRSASTKDCLDSAQENLRAAMAGFEAGIIPPSTALGAQTAWLKAQTDYIDAGIELQNAFSALQAAQGDLKIQ